MSEVTLSPSSEAAVKNSYFSLILADILFFSSLGISQYRPFCPLQEMKRTKSRNSRSDLIEMTDKYLFQIRKRDGHCGRREKTNS